MSATRQVHRSRTLRVSRTRAWHTLTDPEVAAGWLGARGSVDLSSPGSRGVLTEPDGSARLVVVEAVEPGRRIVLRWTDQADMLGGSRVELTLDEAPAGTRVTVTETALADLEVDQAAGSASR